MIAANPPRGSGRWPRPGIAAEGDESWSQRVAAATGADEPLASALEQAALSAPAGQGRPGAARLLEWASDLSPAEAERERRLLKAAIQGVCAGELGSADLWARVSACPPSALRSSVLAGRAGLEGRAAEAEFHLNRAIAQATEPGGDLPAITHGLRAQACLAAGLPRPAVAQALAGLALAGPDLGLERWLTRLLAAGRCYAHGPLAAVRTLASPSAGWPATGQATELATDPATALALGCYRALAGDPRGAIADLSPLASDVGSAAQAQLAARASWLALACHQVGEWRQADWHIGSAIDAAGQCARGEAAPYALGAVLAGFRANWTRAEQLLRAARDLSTAGPDNAVLSDLAQVAIAHAHGGLRPGQPALQRLVLAGDVAGKFRLLWLPLQAEALVAFGPEPSAVAALSELRSLADQAPGLRIACGRLAGLLAERRRDPAAAQRHYETATAPLPGATAPFELGLAEQCYGRLLSSLGAAAGGRALLERARDRLARAGAIPYARRCAADLARSWHQGAAAWSAALSERERSVAHLVAAGMTNQEVAARLYISARTVEYHLAQIYRKLGIRSRRQLSHFA
ncbi:MAG TPA: helix-turn-helix transcriptional regulator [Streptosporangiaceae bacterium]|nr:helix-turn-helix transcriptional regulator [Streptosporangiaceae bacterium]